MAKKKLAVLASTIASLSNNPRSASLYVCSACDSECTCASVGNSTPFCMNCGSHQLTKIKTVANPIKEIDGSDDHLNVVACSHCSLNNIISDDGLRQLGGAKGNLHCIACGSSISLDGLDDVEDDMWDDEESRVIATNLTTEQLEQLVLDNELLDEDDLLDYTNEQLIELLKDNDVELSSSDSDDDEEDEEDEEETASSLESNNSLSSTLANKIVACLSTFKSKPALDKNERKTILCAQEQLEDVIDEYDLDDEDLEETASDHTKLGKRIADLLAKCKIVASADDVEDDDLNETLQEVLSILGEEDTEEDIDDDLEDDELSAIDEDNIDDDLDIDNAFDDDDFDDDEIASSSGSVVKFQVPKNVNSDLLGEFCEQQEIVTVENWSVKQGKAILHTMDKVTMRESDDLVTAFSRWYEENNLEEASCCLDEVDLLQLIQQTGTPNKVELVPVAQTLQLVVDGVSVGVLYPTEATEKYFGTPKHIEALNRAILNAGGVFECASVGFTPIKVKLNKEIANKYFKSVEESKVQKEVASVTNDLRDDVRQCLELAGAGLSRNYFTSHQNPLLTALAQNLSQVGIDNSVDMAQSILASCQDEYSSNLIDLAFSLLEKSIETRNELSDVLSGINTNSVTASVKNTNYDNALTQPFKQSKEVASVTTSSENLGRVKQLAQQLAGSGKLFQR